VAALQHGTTHTTVPHICGRAFLLSAPWCDSMVRSILSRLLSRAERMIHRRNNDETTDRSRHASRWLSQAIGPLTVCPCRYIYCFPIRPSPQRKSQCHDGTSTLVDEAAMKGSNDTWRLTRAPARRSAPRRVTLSGCCPRWTRATAGTMISRSSRAFACERFVNPAGSSAAGHKQPFPYLIAIRGDF